MAPFGLFAGGHPLRRTPLSLAVPLDGTEHEVGLRQLERYSRQRPSVRKRYRRYKGPFIEYLTIEDLKKAAKDWREFLHSRRDGQDSYSVPGSLDAMAERLEENIVYYLTNYLQVVLTIVVLTLGILHGAIVAAVLAGYAYLNDEDLPKHRKLQLSQLKGIMVPIFLAWCLFLTPMAAIISKGILLGTFVVLLHGTLHRSPSEVRHSVKKGVVRWIQRDQAPPEGLMPLLKDVKSHVGELFIDARAWWRWRWFELGEYFVVKRWQLWNAFKGVFRKRRVE